MLEPILDGRPHLPVSAESVREAARVYEALSRGEQWEQGVFSAIALLGNASYTRATPILEGYLTSEDPEVRAWALQALVLDFHLPEHCETAWKMLDEEHHEPKRIAAGCLGFCYMSTKEPAVLVRLAPLVRDTKQHWLVRVEAYAALLSVLGCPYGHPMRPARARMVDFETEVDWALIGRVESGRVPDIEWEEYGQD